MDSLIPLINKLQDIFALAGHDPLDLPQIVVVGAQSSGKSSVLENIVGKDFLPRGKDIVTRRPLVLQLVQIHANSQTSSTSNGDHHDNDNDDRSQQSQQPEEWAEFLHLPHQKYVSFSKVRDEIEADTLRVAGPNKAITKSPIHLRIFSPKFLNLTLVDLPGITKVPIGDQPVDIEMQVRQLVWEYISRPNSIILAVTAANTDLVTSEALKIAREVDPEGLRTLGVLTKVDLMDAGTDALEILEGRSELALRLGFVGVVNRSQQDILNAKPLNEALKHEMEYFRTHPAYRQIAERCGTGFLVQRLNALLVEHIRESLPRLKERLNSLIAARQAELDAFGPEWSELGGAGANTMAKSGLLLRFIAKYCRAFCEGIEGNGPQEGARISFIFNHLFAQSLASEAFPLPAEEVRVALRNSMGTRPSLFVPEGCFEWLVCREIAKIQGPGVRCVELVMEELLGLVRGCRAVQRGSEIARFPGLCARIIQVAGELCQERLEPTLQMVQSLVAIESAYLNTNHPDFIRAGPALATIARLYEHHHPQQSNNGAGLIGQAGSHTARKQGRPLPQGKAVANSPSSNGPPSHLKSTALAVEEEGGSRHREPGFLGYLFRQGSSASSGGHSQPTPSNCPASPPLGAAGPSEAFQNLHLSSPGAGGFFETSETLNPSGINSDDHHPNAAVFPHSPGLASREDLEVHLIRTLVLSYLGIVRKNLQDTIPKTIMHFLVNSVREGLQNRLIEQLYKAELVEELLVEDAAIQVERKCCKDLLQVYRKANAVLVEMMK